MSGQDKFVRDIGLELYEKIKDYIVPWSDIQLGNNIGSGHFADVYEAALVSRGIQVAAKIKKGMRRKSINE